jgi:hypothetical protein
MKPQDKINSFFGLGSAVTPEKPKVGNMFQKESEHPEFEKASAMAHKLTRSAEAPHEHYAACHAHHCASYMGMDHPDQERVEQHKEMAYHHDTKGREAYKREMSEE